MEDKKFCSKCGAEIMDTAKFCPECGAAIMEKKDDVTKITLSEVVLFITENELITWLAVIILFCVVYGFGIAIPIVVFFISSSKAVKKEFPDKITLLDIVSAISAIIVIINIGGAYEIDIYIDVLKRAWISLLILAVLEKANDKIFNKDSRKFISILASIVIYAVMIFTVSNAFNTAENVVSIKKAYLTEYSDDVMIGDAFSKYFDKASWNYFENEYEENIVEFEGKFYLNDKKVTANFQFLLSDDTFTISNLTYNGIIQDFFEVHSLLSAVYNYN